MSAHLIIDQLPAKFDRIYKAADRRSDRSWDVNLARLECSCPEWQERRAGFPPNDARRVCEHIYDKLYSTKAEKSFSPLAQMFIRYGRTMFECREVADDLGVFVIGALRCGVHSGDRGHAGQECARHLQLRPRRALVGQ